MRLLFLTFALLTTLTVQAQSVPQVRLSLSPGSGDRQTVFTLDASQSQNARGNTQNLEYQFRVDQFSSRTPYSRTPRITFRASRTGTLTAEVRVRDINTGATSVAAQRYIVRENQQREVQIRVSNTNPLEGDSVTYEAVVFGNGITRSELQSRWDFNSDGRFDTNFRGSLIASDTPAPGRAFPTVEVKFPDGSTIIERGFEVNTSNTRRDQGNSTNFITTDRRGLKKPVIEVTPLSQVIKENTNVTFDGSKTELLQNSFLEWVVESRTIRDQEKINYTFRTSGSKTVTLRHCLVDNPTYCLESSVDIEVETKPNDQYLTLFWNNLSDQGRTQKRNDYALITASDEVRITVRPQGQPSVRQSFLYRWDFEGDGAWDTDFQEETSVEHRYHQPGNYVAVVEGLPSVTTRNFKSLTAFLPVYVERNRAPFGDFDFQQSNNFVGERVTYTAVVKDPESGNRVDVRFDSDADGVWDSDFRQQRSWWWIYDTPGVYNVRMQIRDPQGRLEEVTKPMTILPMPTPQTQVKVSHRSQTENGSIRLDASESVGRKLTYEWTVQGRRDIKLQGAQTNLRLTAGDYQVQLVIRDRLGASDSVVFPVSFVPATTQTNRAPMAGAIGLQQQTAFSGPSTSNIINQLPGARMQNNFILPPQGAPSIASPFQIDAGFSPQSNGISTSMRAIP